MVLGMLALFVVFSLLVMLLWNAVMPDLLEVGSLNWLQAAGLLLLCRILFGGLGHGIWGSVAFKGMRDHVLAMSPEQREAFVRRMQERVAGHGRHPGFCRSRSCGEPAPERHGDENADSLRNGK
jgi:hypothetical protein